MKRVPAGTTFSPMELVFSVFDRNDLDFFLHVLTALQLVEDDYLGGQGTRGSGKVAFNGLKVTCKRGADYSITGERVLGNLSDLSDAQKQELRTWLDQQLPIAGG